MYVTLFRNRYVHFETNYETEGVISSSSFSFSLQPAVLVKGEVKVAQKIVCNFRFYSIF